MVSFSLPLFASLLPQTPNESLPQTETTTSQDPDRPLCFKRYELLMEFMNLRNDNQLGIYVMPCADTLNVWYGVLFVHHGLYSSGVFKFRILIPENYPLGPPSVMFLTNVWHPLIDDHGHLTLDPAFPTWRPNQDYLVHLVRYIKTLFRTLFLNSLEESDCSNKEAYRLYRQDPVVFKKMAQQCAQLSITEFYLFDHLSANNLIRFKPMTELGYDMLKLTLL